MPADHLRDALLRAQFPFAGAARNAGIAAWSLVVAELETDARIRSIMVPVAGKRMKHYEYVATVLTASPARG